jgi:hypothetical protein
MNIYKLVDQKNQLYLKDKPSLFSRLVDKTKEYKVLPGQEDPSVVRGNRVYDKTKYPMVYKRVPGAPEKIDYNDYSYYRTIGKDAIDDIKETGVIRGKKRYVEAVDESKSKLPISL